MYVAPTLSLQGGLAAEKDNATALVETLANAGKPPKGGWNDANSEPLAIDMASRMRQKLMVTYVRYGAIGWNWEDVDGPVPFDVDAIIDDYAIARPVAEKCDELYGETVTRPLLTRLAQRSPTGPMDHRTSRTSSTQKRRGSSSRANGQVASKRLTA